MSRHAAIASERAGRRASLWHGLAWVGLCLALGAHVADEALGDFLSFYNPAVESLQEHIPFLRLPTFTFEVWLTLLVEAVLVLLMLAPFAFCGVRWMAKLSYPFLVLMFFNGLLHIFGTVYYGRAVPGLYTSPLLLAAAACLLLSVHHAEKYARGR